MRGPGGPGGSGVLTVAFIGEMLQKVVGDEFDIVGFDPRCVSHKSHPSEPFDSN